MLLLGLLIGVAGCASKQIILHPITDTDIAPMTAGEPYTPAKDGWFLSNGYVEDIAAIRAE